MLREVVRTNMPEGCLQRLTIQGKAGEGVHGEDCRCRRLRLGQPPTGAVGAGTIHVGLHIRHLLKHLRQVGFCARSKANTTLWAQLAASTLDQRVGGLLWDLSGHAHSSRFCQAKAGGAVAFEEGTRPGARRQLTNAWEVRPYIRPDSGLATVRAQDQRK